MAMRHVALLACSLAFALGAGSAHAYIDPGTGNAILQAVVAGVLGAGLALKVFWQHIRAFFANLFSRRNKTDEPQS